MNKSFDGTGRRNVYECEKCHGVVVTMDLEHGVPPFMIACEAVSNCGGNMYSSFYPKGMPLIRPHFVWRKPYAVQTLSDGERHHVNNGGLLMYPTTDKELQKL